MTWNHEDPHAAAVGAAVAAVDKLKMLDRAGIKVSDYYRQSVADWQASRAALTADCDAIEARRLAAQSAPDGTREVIRHDAAGEIIAIETYHPTLAQAAE